MRVWRMMVVAAGSALVLSACGSSGPDTGGGCTPKGAAASGTTAAQTVKVVPDPVTSGKFDPQTISVKVGDSVTWDFQDSSLAHTVTASDGSFDSCSQDAGNKFTVTFSTAGTVKYTCTLHALMPAGTVTVG